MRIRLKPAITVSLDSDAKYTLFSPEETSLERVIDGWVKQFSGIAKVDALGTKTLSLGDVTAVKGLWLSASKDCQVSLNNAIPPLQLRVGAEVEGDQKAGLVVEADITSIQVVAGADAVDLVYVVWGDVAA